MKLPQFQEPESSGHKDKNENESKEKATENCGIYHYKFMD